MGYDVGINMKNKKDSEFAKLLLESIPDGVFTINAHGQITSWNPAMERITGYSALEAKGRSCKLLKFSRCNGKNCPSEFKDCEIFKKGFVESKECFLRNKNGLRVPVVKNARLIKDDECVVETITDLTELHVARSKAEEVSRQLGETYRLGNIIGKSNAMQKIFSSIISAASSEATVLVQGESGTGKELVAGAIHYNSNRADKPFIAVNCNALSESLLESELFGHVKGAFTGAIRERIGRIEEAEGGTLFLDEIGEISPFLQIKLLRVLQEREIERVGESRTRKIDIRIITATNKDLYDLVREGFFREDLYYRLKVFPINIPPLRERRSDIPLLVSHFIQVKNKKNGKRIDGVSEAAMRILMDCPWRGNVRELENAIEHAFVLCKAKHIDIFDLPVEIRQLEYQTLRTGERQLPARNIKNHSRIPLTRALLLDVLSASDWNKAETARRVGHSRASVWKYMKKWNIPLTPPSDEYGVCRH